ncbi:hypothetical protein [Chitinimonas sp.]|uniref:hypothetical protein n=1 Tax=Chitinimonas sp. TaxID=1934313 RepID=UPI0035B0097D
MDKQQGPACAGQIVVAKLAERAERIGIHVTDIQRFWPALKHHAVIAFGTAMANIAEFTAGDPAAGIAFTAVGTSHKPARLIQHRLHVLPDLLGRRHQAKARCNDPAADRNLAAPANRADQNDAAILQATNPQKRP